MSDHDVVNAVLRNHFMEFAQRCFLTLNPGTPFMPNWHLEALAYHLELVRTGKIKRLIINMPPRSLKSIFCSVAFVAFVLGHEPTKRLIVASYGAELAAKLGNDCRIIMQSKWYRRLFPGTIIFKNTEAEVTTTRHGERLATSVGGAPTGRGGDILIIDDPLKPQDALSDSKRESVNEWFYNTFLSRLDDIRIGAIILVMQRLHIDDLTGKLLRGSKEWTVLNLAAIAEEDEQIQIGEDRYHRRKAGDPLHPARAPLEALESLRVQIGSETFAAQYQQNPVMPGGNMIKRDWVQRYENPPERTASTRILQSWDTASKDGEQNDWSVCTTWQIQDGKYYLVDVLRGRFNYPTLKARAIEHAKLHKPTTILIEDTGVGTALALEPELRSLGFAVIAVPVEHNKKTRMEVQSAKFEGGQVYFPKEARWLEKLEEELFAFPASRNDDQVDSTSQALAHKIKRSGFDEKSLEGLNNFYGAMAFDNYLGRVTGRPY